MKPVVLIDVDGPLNPYAAKATKRPEGYLTHYLKPKGFQYGKGLRVWLNPLHGPSLMALETELVWATMWEEDANKLIAPEIGLPELKFIDFGPNQTSTLGTKSSNNWRLYFKTPRIAYMMESRYPGRPFLWIDDECSEHDENFLKEACGVNVKAYYVDPRIGLTDKDFEEIDNWLTENTTMEDDK